MYKNYTKLIIGLGNPGKQYKNHRHNLGFILLDKIASYFSITFDNNENKSLFTRYKDKEVDFILLKPQTFMNLSGEAALYISKVYNIYIDNIIVIYDDMDLPFSRIKINKGGSSAGHNGIKNLIEKLESDQFIRVRVGISRPHNGKSINNYVLSSFNKSELHIIDNDIYINVLDAIKTLIYESINVAQNRFNSKK